MRRGRRAAPRLRGSGWGPLAPDADGQHTGQSGKAAAMGAEGRLNDLSRTEWRKFSQRSVFGGADGAPWMNGLSRLSERQPLGPPLHPDGFPHGLAEGMVGFFTRRGGTVLDPFVGTGGTLAACDALGRVGIGIELHERWAGIARDRSEQRVVCADAIDAGRIAEKAGAVGEGGEDGEDGEDGVDLLLTGVPRPVRAAGRGSQYMKYIRYMDAEGDVSLAETYAQYVEGVAARLEAAIWAVRRGGHIVLVQPNEAVSRGSDPGFLPAAFDVAGRVAGMDGVEFAGEKVWVAPPSAGRRRAADGGGTLRGYPHRYVAGIEGAESTLHCMVFSKYGRRGGGHDAGEAAKCP